MSEPCKLSVVIPVFNEEANLDELIRRCLAACRSAGRPFEMILVDDGSRDRSAEMLEAAAAAHPEAIKAVFLNRNYGQHAAIMAGFEQVSGEIVVTLDADLQNPPEEIPRLATTMDEGFDVVGTVRANRQDSLFRRLASALINRAVQKATGVMMHDYGCMLRAYRATIVRAMLMCHERSTFIPVLGNSFARRTTEIEVGHDARKQGDSKYSFSRLISLMFDLVTSMTTYPLRLLSIMGLIVSALGIGFGFFLLFMRLIFGTAWAAEGVFTLFAILFIFVGAQFIGMGLLGEYLGRVYNDVRARPRYFIQRVICGNQCEEKMR
ncbi:undecaprenyl phosphate-L-Ara4FN transferase [Desulfosarcina cetonica]|nr:undecaprenyl phosphate-L-Ara4FN transferase [Desulfosarcina cetonica]